MTTINPTYIQIVKPVATGRVTVFPVAVGRNISQAQDTAEQTAAIIEREVGRLLQLALAAAQIPGVTPASGSVYAQGIATGGSSLTAAQVWQHIIEDGFSAEQLTRIMAAALAGTSEKAGSTITFKGVDGATDRIVGSFDAENNRTGAILDGA